MVDVTRATVKATSGTLSTDAAAPVNLETLVGRNVLGYEIHNTAGTGTLYWTGEGVTATTSSIPIAAGESSGFVPGNDRTLSLIREAGVAVTYVVMGLGR